MCDARSGFLNHIQLFVGKMYTMSHNSLKRNNLARFEIYQLIPLLMSATIHYLVVQQPVAVVNICVRFMVRKQIFYNCYFIGVLRKVALK